MRILCFGDSNTYGYDPRSFLGGRYPAPSRWVDILEERTGWRVINGGENGREIPSRESEAARFADLLSRTQPDLVVMMLGTNDILQGRSAEETAERMERFLGQIHLPGDRLLLVTPPPVKWGTWVTEEQVPEESIRLGVVYEHVAQGLNISWLNAGDWGITLAFDGVHFDEDGHRRFAEKLEQALRK